MGKHSVKLITNPNADLGQAWRRASDLRPVAAGFARVDWAGTVYPGHAAELARQAAEDGYELVIAVGGDGTAHEVVNGLMQVPSESRPRLGLVPMGSGNDFAHAIGMDTRPAFALRQIFSGQPHRLDVGRLQDEHGRSEYWINVSGIGFDAKVVIHSRNYVYLRGFLGYLLAVLQTILLNHEAPRLQITTDQERWENELLLLTLCNGRREGGGFVVSPQAHPGDGFLNYTAVRRVPRLMMLRLIPEFLRGSHGRFHQVRMGQFQTLELQSDRPLVIHTDGEIFSGFGMDVRRITAEILPGALEVMA